MFEVSLALLLLVPGSNQSRNDLFVIVFMNNKALSSFATQGFVAGHADVYIAYPPRGSGIAVVRM